jgi:hypothetical protein
MLYNISYVICFILMSVGHVRWQCPLVMSVGHIHWRCPLGMSVGGGRCLYQLLCPLTSCLVLHKGMKRMYPHPHMRLEFVLW